MLPTYMLGVQFEQFVRDQVASGRFNDVSEVVGDALRLMEDRERRRQARDDALAMGLADIDAGRVSDMDLVFDELDARYAEPVIVAKNR